MTTVTGHDDRHTAGTQLARSTMRVEHKGGDKFEIAVRGHRIMVDQPVEMHGEDAAPTPTELFVAGLASCVGFYARRFLSRHRLPAEGLAVDVAYAMGANPARVGAVELTILLPEGFPEERRDALLAVAGHCTVHNSITVPPDIALLLRTSRRHPEPVVRRS